ncbi:DUF6909 family protein [Psychroflexus sp. MES1-P1E]|uniref:DUF6909 family protein n=1 Tax=Psychroflexus sp. MES1-P1E TaxID=2058320 RepID=UPI000C7C158A|nr:hypothetical protein [Psychroflexus sp. MES1-P1E]PKG41304.1 hypothetical protein CXF67_15920 [Psychroflexus sp. MES1-P1E]
MTEPFNIGRNRAQESTNAIERMYITMRHLFIRGFYKPMGVSGETLREALLTLRPEIYGTIAEPKVELSGLQYIIERLPEGIEECSFINLTSDEGYSNSHFKAIIPPKRRRNCYRIDEEQMNIEITRGRSEIYDILTHLTFMFIESHKIMRNVVINEAGHTSRDWEKLSAAVLKEVELSQHEREIAITHTANILGRTFAEITQVYDRFATKDTPDKFLHLIYNLGKLAIREIIHGDKRVITFSPVVRERLGHHIHGEVWANNIKKTLHKHDLIHRKLHIVSANMHSVMNTLFSPLALKDLLKEKSAFEVYEELSNAKNKTLRRTVTEKAKEEGMIVLDDESGTNIDVQIFDLAKLSHYKGNTKLNANEEAPVIIVMDYAFGEQAYETMDELLKPYKDEEKPVYMNVDSISIMGKAGILEGGKGDLMIPDAHLFEGTADNYPFYNELTKSDFEDQGLRVYDGSMVTVLGTSLQNRDLLKFFHDSTWNVIGLEMEGAHYQKAIQAASRLRGNISPKVKLRYAYYASDNPLETGSTLASGGLGTAGVKPTYLITEKILEQIIDDAIQNLK